MTATIPFPREVAQEVRDTCLCFAAQRTARELARRFDRVFAPLGVTNGQFSMMVAMGGMGGPKLGVLARFLAMDHATVTAAVRKLERHGWVVVTPDPIDRRSRRVALTDEGALLLEKVVPLWREEHRRLTLELDGDEHQLRREILRLAPPLLVAPPPAA